MKRILILLSVLCQLVLAQSLEGPQGPDANIVDTIRVEGLSTVDDQAVVARLAVSKGGSYAPSAFAEKVKTSVRSLWESGLFSNVAIDADYRDAGHLALVVRVTELPTLGKWSIEGNDEVLEEDLKPLVQLQEGGVFGPSQLERDRQSILEHYRSKGFLLAEVSVDESVAKDDRHDVVFRIREGDKVMVDSILVRGNERVPSDEIVSGLASEVDHWWGEGEFKEEKFEADDDSVVAICRHFGFLDAAITEARIEYLPDTSFRVYVGRSVRGDASVAALADALDADVQDPSNPMHRLAGQGIASANPYFRKYRKGYSETDLAVPVPNVRTEEQAVNILNNVITYTHLRQLYIESRSGVKDWHNDEIDSLLVRKDRTGIEDRRLARLLLEDRYPALALYDSTNASSRVRLHFGVTEGKRYYAGRFAFAGNEVQPDIALTAQVQLDSGDVFDWRKYEATKSNVMNLYREDGYLFARIDDHMQYKDSVVDVNIALLEGLPAQIRRVNIIGNTRTNDKVVRREVKLFPGDTYRQSLMERSFRDIMQLNFFDNVVPDIQPVENSEQDVDLVFQVAEREAGTGTFSAGMAYSQSDGLVGTLGLSIPNCCMGDGRAATLNVEYGASKQNYSIGFSEPWFLDQPTTVGGSINYTWWDDSPDIRRYGFTTFVGRRLTWPDDYFSARLDYSLQVNRQGSNVDGSMIRNSGIESAVGVTVIRDDKNLPMFPTDGSRISVSVDRAGGPFGGDFDFWRTEVVAKWWFPMPFGMGLGIHNEYGFMDGTILQYRTLYQMGGMLGYKGQLRGYSPGSIGYGRLGRSYQSFTTDLTYPVADNRFYLLAFFDAGNVFGPSYYSGKVVEPGSLDHPFREWDPGSLLKDYGFGFRVIVPMLGILGFDFGWPLDPAESYSGISSTEPGSMQFNFVIGQTF